MSGLTVNGVSANISGNNWSVTVPVTAFQDNDLELVATDVIGNATTPVTRSVTIDADYTPPTVTWLSPTPAHNSWNNTNFTVRVDAADDQGGKSGLSTFAVTYEGITVTDNVSPDTNGNPGEISFVYSVPNNTVKDVVFAVTAIDNSLDPKNQATANITRTVRIDTQAPAITFEFPTQSQYVESEFRTVNATVVVTDEGIGVDEVLFGGSSSTELGDNRYRYRFTNVNDGWHTIDVTATDSLGNESSSSITYNFRCVGGEFC